MEMLLMLQYRVTGCRGIVSDWMNWDLPLDGQPADEFVQAVKTGRPLSEFPALSEALAQAQTAIRAVETDRLLEEGNPYALACYGRVPADADEINILVHAHDKTALAALHMEDRDDDALDEFDALLDLPPEKFPYRCDLDPAFQPDDPFDGAWSIETRIALPLDRQSGAFDPACDAFDAWDKERNP